MRSGSKSGASASRPKKPVNMILNFRPKGFQSRFGPAAKEATAAVPFSLSISTFPSAPSRSRSFATSQEAPAVQPYSTPKVPPVSFSYFRFVAPIHPGAISPPNRRRVSTLSASKWRGCH